jgi:hypothetical protein
MMRSPQLSKLNTQPINSTPFVGLQQFLPAAFVLKIKGSPCKLLSLFVADAIVISRISLDISFKELASRVKRS